MQLQNDMRWYDAGRDLDAVQRIWLEIGWAEDDDDLKGVAQFLSVGDTLTGIIDDVAECAVCVDDGTMRLGGVELPMCGVTAVTTSRVGRKRRFAQRLTATQLGRAAENGAAVAVLGMFEQGFYDRVGFGSGSYQNRFRFNPGDLRVDVAARTPTRLTEDDWRDMHGALLKRQMGNGGCSLSAPELLAAELQWCDNGFGLGYRDNGELTHFFWCDTKAVEHGPYNVEFFVYRNRQQMMELLALLKSLGDQVNSLEMEEPHHLHLQDLLSKPFASRRRTRGGAHADGHQGDCWWQLRILDLAQCVGAYRWSGAPLSFNLSLHDPAAEHTAGAWSGVAGDYEVTIGQTSGVQTGHAAKAPVLSASVNAFSRWLFGAVTATKLAASDDFVADEGLLEQLDSVMNLEPPTRGWDF